MNTCRDCGTPLAAEAVKYSVRHYLCPECAIERGVEFLQGLKDWQLERLPIGPLRKANLLEWVAAEMVNRQGEHERWRREHQRYRQRSEEVCENLRTELECLRADPDLESLVALHSQVRTSEAVARKYRQECSEISDQRDALAEALLPIHAVVAKLPDWISRKSRRALLEAAEEALRKAGRLS